MGVRVANFLTWLWRRLWLLPVVLLILALGVSITISDLGRIMSSPEQAPAAADLIVPLGGDVHRRAGRAAELYRAGLAPRLFLAGPVDARVALLEDQGIPPSAILTDGKSRHSWDEAMNTFALMERNGWKTVLVVSDPPHLRRLSWTWEHVFVGSGMDFRLIAAPMPGWDAAHWWRDPGSAAYVKLEVEKLFYYLFRYGSDSPEYDLPALPSLHRGG